MTPGSRREALVHLGDDAEARLRRAAGNAPLAELTVLLCALSWALGRFQVSRELVQVSVPWQPHPGAGLVPRVTILLDPDPACSLRAHTERVQKALIQALRGARPAATSAAAAVALDTVAAHGEPALADAELRLRYRGSGQIWIDAPERAGSDWPCAVVRAMARYLEALGEPDVRLGEIPLLSPIESSRLSRLEDGRDAPAVPGASVVTAFERRAREHAQRPAVIGSARRISHAELHRDANRLARHLRAAHGIRAGEVVGVLLDNDADAVVCLLAVLKAGGVYLPIEEAWPEARIEEVIAAAGVSALLTSSAHLLRATAAVPTFAVDLQLAGLATSDLDLEGPIDPAQAAYILFTSGSTGRPKGVRISHASLFNMLQDQVELLRVSPADRILQPFSLAFDASLLSIGLALLSGAAVVPLPRQLLGDAPAVAAHLRDAGVTIASFVPSMLRALAPEDLGGVHTIVCGGEALTPADVARHAAGRRLVNSYGATETTCCACAGDLASGGEITLGRPVANSSVRVLGADGARVPPGVIGEICVDGAAVALGYLGSSEGFEPSAFRPGATLYRTGDLGFFRDDGRIQLVGRRDRQLKLHGQRIEPAEIEAQLMTSPAVRAAHVFVERGQLWAFVAGEDLLAPEALLPSLAARLPHYMVPARVVSLPVLPTGATGKVDEAALRALAARASAQPDREEAESEWERRVIAVWSEVLGSDDVGASSDFFVLGGNSLLALQVLARIEKAFAVRIGLSAFFQAPTVRGLSALVEGANGVSDAAPIPAAPARGLHELSPSQLGMWLDGERRLQGAVYNVPRVFRIEGTVDPERLRLAVEDLGRRHEALRTSFVTVAGQPRQRIHPEPTATLQVEDVLPEGRREARIDEIVSTPFHLDRDPLLRVVLLRDRQDATLVIVAHHIVCDGWSMALLLGELSALHGARAAALPPPPGPSLAYRSSVEWQVAEAASPRIRAQLADWKQHLAGGERRATLTPDHPRPPGHVPVDEVVSRRHARDRLDRLQRFAARRRSSPFQVLTAALACALREGSEEPRVAVGTPVSLRTRPEMEDQIGLFLNMVVLSIDTQGARTFLDVLTRTEAEVAWALERRECPHALVAREAHASTLFDVEVDYRAATMKADPASLPLGSAIAHRAARNSAPGRKFEVEFLFTEVEDGLQLDVLFDALVHTRSTVERLVGRMESLLDAVLEGGDPEIALPRPLAAAALASRRSRLERLRRAAPAPAPASIPASIPASNPASIPASIPATIPVIREVPPGASILDLLAEDRGRLDDLSDSGGAVLYRGGDLTSAARFQAALQALGEPLFRYTERSSARKERAPLVYTSTEHPADQEIKLHTEHSYAACWPLRLIFCCIHPADRGGETPLAAIPSVMSHLRPETLARFREQGVLYVRNLGGGMGLDWPEVFGTTDRGEVEAHCRGHGIAWEWWGDSRLTLRFRRPALRPHPITGRELWFNHAYFFNPASLDPTVRAALRRHCAPTDLPFQTFYGDGSEIPEAVIEEIAAAFAAAQHAWSWQRGDLLILDNMMVAHGRRPFEGPREVLVAMSRPYPPGAMSGAAGAEP